MAAAVVNKWKNIKTPGSFSNSTYFYKGLEQEKSVGNKSEKDVKKILQNDITFQTARTLRRNFPRRKDLAYYFSEKWEADLGDIGADRFVDLKSKKQKGRFFFLAVDLFSKRVFAKGLKNKSADSVLSALKEIAGELEAPYTLPLELRTDKGTEFTNKKLKAYLKKNYVHLSFALGEHKCAVAERYIRSYKKVLIPFLESSGRNLSWEKVNNAVANNLNRRYNRSIKMAPNDVTNHYPELQTRYLEENPPKPFLSILKQQEDFKKGKPVQDSRQKFVLGQKVVIPFRRQILDKESDRQFRYEVFSIDRLNNESTPFLYGLKDGKGDRLKRLYYATEMRKVKEPKSYPIRSILQTKSIGRRKFVLVSWLDHSDVFNEWIPASALK